MAVKSFNFSSPGVFLNEIDQSQLQREPAPVGPIIIGRAQRGPGMRPVTVASYEEFVQTFGDPIAGGDSTGDVWRSGVPAGPTYGPYAAQAWLANNPTVTYVRLLGVQSDGADTAGTSNNAGQAGWTYGLTGDPDELKANGLYGLYVFPYPIAGATGSKADAVSYAANATNNKTAFSVNVPTTIGGLGSSVTFTTKNAVAGAGGGTNVQIKIQIDTATTVALIVAAINGVSSADVVYDTGITGTPAINGIPGLSASVGSTTSKISLYAKYPGAAGNFAVAAGDDPNASTASPLVDATGVNFTSAPPTNYSGSLAAVWYCSGSVPVLSGAASDRTSLTTTIRQNSKFIESDSNGLFTVEMKNSAGLSPGIDGTSKKIFGFDPTSDKFIRKVFNTNPQNANLAGDTGLSSSDTNYYGYWLGETFENDINNGLYKGTTLYSGTQKVGIIVPLKSLNNRLNQEAEGNYVARTGWVIGQDLTAGQDTNFSPLNSAKLFRFIALDGGDWIRNNLKVTINNIIPPQNAAQKYGTFDVEVRKIDDTDANKKLIESFTGCTLDPSSPDYIGRKIGTYYYEWDDNTRRLNEKGSYPNNSKFIRVEIDSSIEDGGTPFIPFGVLGPLKYLDTTGSITNITNQSIVGKLEKAYSGTGIPPLINNLNSNNRFKLAFPSLRTRVSSSEDSLTTYTLADWGAATTRDASSILYNQGVNDILRLPATGTAEFTSGVASSLLQHAWAFSLDDVRVTGSFLSGSTWVNKFYVWTSGSKAAGTSYTAVSGTFADLLNDGVNSFTTVFQGGTDGFNILEKEPLRNTAMTSNSTNDNSYIYYTYRRAIDTVVDPEFVEGNLLAAPGLVFEPLTQYMTQVAENRGDVLAVIDSSGDSLNRASYVTKYELSDNAYTSDRSISPSAVVTRIKQRNLNTSYGTTYYPWVQISDSNSGKIVTVPPSIPAIGAMSYTDRVQAPWFAPAGFNRGGLSSGNAGVNVVNVVKKLSSADRDKLYPVNINPITSFPNEGIVIFGQKTLQAIPSALDRINVRRLMLYIKRGIAIISNTILFEPNVEDTWNNFKDKAEPFLADVKARYGLEDFRLILDSTTTTPDLIDQNIMYAKILLKPARAIEFIAIDFFITKSGANFNV